MFFLDLDGHVDDAAVAAAIAGLRSLAEMVRVLGSFPAA
jgi:prephenate dehydratase